MKKRENDGVYGPFERGKCVEERRFFFEGTFLFERDAFDGARVVILERRKYKGVMNVSFTKKD
jgi:hypothetical protein